MELQAHSPTLELLNTLVENLGEMGWYNQAGSHTPRFIAGGNVAIVCLLGLEQHAGTNQLGPRWPSGDGNPIPRLQEIEVRRPNAT